MKWMSLSIVYLLVLSLHKNETMFQAYLFFISSLRKNETGQFDHSSFSVTSLLKNEADTLSILPTDL